MSLQPNELPDAFSQDPASGPGYDLDDQGAVTRVYCKRDGEMVGWILDLNPEYNTGAAIRTRIDRHRFPDDSDDSTIGDPELFRDWVLNHANDMVALSQREDAFYCAFCMRPRREVPKLIAGPEVSICNECVAQCSEILAEED